MALTVSFYDKGYSKLDDSRALIDKKGKTYLFIGYLKGFIVKLIRILLLCHLVYFCHQISLKILKFNRKINLIKNIQ
jgi:hypothetical protein